MENDNPTAPDCLLRGSCIFKESLLQGGERMSAKDLKHLRFIVIGLFVALIAMIVIPLSLMIYPFKTVTFHGKAQVLNPGQRVPVNGVVNFRFHFTKWIDSKGLIIRTLIRHDGREIAILDSNTVISNRPKSPGGLPEEGEGFFYLNGNPEIASHNGKKDCQVIFSVSYTLFGVRPILMQYESEPFEIYVPEGYKCQTYK